MIPLFFAMGAQGQVSFYLHAYFIEAGGFPFDIIYLVGQFFYDCDQFIVGGGKHGAVCNQLLKH